MLKQKARAIALGVLIWDLVLTALSLPVAYVLRHVVLPSFFPAVFRTPLSPIKEYGFLLVLIIPLWGLLFYGAGFYRSHRTTPLVEEIWGAMKVAFGGTAMLDTASYPVVRVYAETNGVPPGKYLVDAATREIGGFAALGAYLADDYMLGELIARRGYRVVLSSYVVETTVVEHSFRALFLHELRWSRTMRALRPSASPLAARSTAR